MLKNVLFIMIFMLACKGNNEMNPSEGPIDPSHKNHLADETSPYLLQHADNPVDWYPWGEEALV